MKVDDPLPPLRLTVSAGAIRQWVDFIRDPNPLHLDTAVVAARGLGDRLVNQGPANLGYVITMLQKALPGATIEALDSRFVDTVFAGDAVEAGGRIAATEVLDDGTQRLHCACWLTVATRGRVLEVAATLRFSAARTPA